MKAWSSLAAFAVHLTRLETKVAGNLHHALKQVAGEIEKTAQSKFGVYQHATGGFPRWAPLTDATQADRVRQGYPADEPLLRSGALRDSVSHQVSGLEAVIGSDDEVMVYQELGTQKIPPRAVLGPAALQHRRKIKKRLGQAAARGIASANYLPGYDFEV